MLVQVKKIKSVLLRNKYDINEMKIKKNHVNLEYWKKKVNIGDGLAPVIIKWMLNRKKIDTDKETKKTTHLFTIGSILTEGIVPKNGVVWGSGIHCLSGIKKLGRYSDLCKLDIRAVRGPVTAQILKTCNYHVPSNYGDPGVLMPLIYQPKVEKNYDISVICHFSKQSSCIDEDYHQISVCTNDYKFFIDEICKSKIIISSSLHGIILSEAYGVPAIFWQDGMENELLKFYDWYYSTNRKDIKFAYKFQDALEMKPMVLPDLQNMRKTLIESFPYDLWKS